MPETVVMKFGGTSVGSTERIMNVAKRVTDYIRKTGNGVVVVVSAMSGETDRMLGLARQLSGKAIPPREYHQLLASGEQLSSALTAMAIQSQGFDSVSLLGHQVPIRTEHRFGQNLISEIDSTRLRELLGKKVVPVVAGFQGVDSQGDFTTLGRGGSDTTGVALAAALDSCRCYIYTDVDGVYSALPSLCKNARKLPQLSYEEMLELASSGAKVLQARSVSLAYKYRVPLVVCSSFSDAEGTEIVEEYPGMEDAVVSSVTAKNDQARVTLRNLPDKPGTAARIFDAIAKKGVIVDEISQSRSLGEGTALSFTLPQESVSAAEDVLKTLLQKDFAGTEFDVGTELAKLSIVGEGMRNHVGVAAEMFGVLGREGINIELVTTSEIKISVFVKQKYSELGVRALHEFFVEKRMNR